MSHWGFVAAAYAVALAGTLGLLAASYAAMRRAEAEADSAKGER
jgi:Na+-driven multidrug efflux pump